MKEYIKPVLTVKEFDTLNNIAAAPSEFQAGDNVFSEGWGDDGLWS